jgi:hypothetical protein
LLLFVCSDNDGEQVVPSAVAQRIIVEYPNNENVTSAELMMRLRALIGNETLSRTQVYDWSKSLKEGQTEVEILRKLHLLQGKV